MKDILWVIIVAIFIVVLSIFVFQLNDDIVNKIISVVIFSASVISIILFVSNTHRFITTTNEAKKTFLMENSKFYHNAEFELIKILQSYSNNFDAYHKKK